MRILLILFFLTLSLQASIKVAVAANVSFAMPALIAAFHQKHPNIQVDTTMGSSGKLTTQIIHKAPFDLFLSANMKYPTELLKRGLVEQGPFIYAQGMLVLFSLKPRSMSSDLRFLLDPQIKRIAMANMQTAPYGFAARQALKKQKLFDVLSAKIIQGESVAQTVQYTLTAVDVGFIPKSALLSPKMRAYKDQGSWMEVDANLYEPIEQGIVLLKSAGSEARIFYDFILSDQARKIFQAYGYKTKQAKIL